MADRPLPSSFDENEEYQETGLQKIGRKLREEPLIPLGTGLTCLALWNAFRAMRRGDHVQVQRMFRARVAAQAFTVVAMVAGGAYYGADREKRKELIKLEAQQRAEEKKEKWIRELEMRDEEDKKLQAAMKRKRDRLEQKRLEEQAQEQGSKVATLSADSTTTAAASTEAESKVDGTKGGWGWFGTKKGSAENTQANAEVPKK
ncbi:mitochondrial hypoxia responsive domain-containing protein [Xylaria bambusicola]|uniref:mitochondrial hypoxia responsive domain-containing protein n=1 Tax=Xylaria bambusicola TaxID=326684 RepID=UPI002008BC18|nr:mitochondrial hypoxia responsive domain-containing protein [Xylaria bambusicola]KAI0505712.1 mitochondrial hypoxia responsive domain-containing protein [Xylaria bambusicola]